MKVSPSSSSHSLLTSTAQADFLTGHLSWTPAACNQQISREHAGWRCDQQQVHFCISFNQTWLEGGWGGGLVEGTMSLKGNLDKERHWYDWCNYVAAGRRTRNKKTGISLFSKNTHRLYTTSNKTVFCSCHVHVFVVSSAMMPLESIVERPAVWLQLFLQDVVGSTHPGVARLPLPLLQVLPQALQHSAVRRVRRQVPHLQRVSSASRQWERKVQTVWERKLSQ